MSYTTLCIGDFHIKDLNNTYYDKWQTQMFRESFNNIRQIILDNNITKVLILGDVFDTPPKNNALALFNEFIETVKKETSLKDIILIAGNHTVISGKQNKEYYETSLSEFFESVWGIKVLDYDEMDRGNQLFCGHGNIHKLERLSKDYNIIFSHFRAGLSVTNDEIDTTRINLNTKLCILGDIHQRLKFDNIIYTGSPIDTHFSENNLEEINTPSVLLLNEKTLETRWVSIFTTTYRKIKKTYDSVEAFLKEAKELSYMNRINNCFYKVVIQDKKHNLRTIRAKDYEDFCNIHLERTDLEYVKENKSVIDLIKETLDGKKLNDNLLDFIILNNEKKELENEIRNTFTYYEKAVVV